MKRLRTTFKTVAILLFLVQLQTSFAEKNEQLVKAIFLEKFTQFIDWPSESTIEDSSSPFILGVIGKNPFGTNLEDIYSSQKIKNRKVEIRYLSNIEEIEACHLLFIGKAKKDIISQIISYTRDKSILTVSDSKGNAKRGVCINFYQDGEKIRFEINQTAVQISGFKMSYKLLKLARIVKPVKSEL
ncbi:MAG: YfiR family protein [Candidatus Electryonea clarkiae]|nr:YfiR family protein [Candidatus Electryonea clarkiae]MDP8286965.1 YfiR family protein [Candidatus Electryonea clarkiae]